MDTQLKRGILDISVLAELNKGDSYGYQIIKDLEPYVELSESTLYPILKRLESSNFVDVYSVEKQGDMYNKENFNNKCKMIDDDGNKYTTFNIGTNKEVLKGDRIKLTAKVKSHSEYMGIKFTALNYCKIIWNQREDIAKYNL